MKTLYTLGLALVLLAAACKSPQRLYEKENYDRAVTEALERLRKGKAEDDDIRALEAAFNQMNAKDVQLLDRLLNETDPDRWERILPVAQRIDSRQMKIQPYLPIRYPGSGKEVSLKFHALRDLIPQVREKAADRRMDLGRQALDLGRQGDKVSAREAFTHFQKSLEFRPGDDGAKTLQQEAENLSYTLVRLVVDNDARVILPSDYRHRLEETFISSVDNPWLRIVPEEQRCPECDLVTSIILTSVNVSPDGLDERKTIERKTVEDGFQYVLDKRGNVMKDSNGNDIKVPVYKEVWAEVMDTRQFKAARLEGFLEIREPRSNRLLKRTPLAAETQFKAESVWFVGDKRALKPETVKRLKHEPVPYPTEQAMLADAVDLFREEMGRKARELRKLLLR